MSDARDPNVTADFPPVPADSLSTPAPERDSSGTGGSPSGEAPMDDLPAVPGYRVLREIARGGMGRVFAALDLGLDRDVALKILLPGADADRFVRESKITARLPHPGIPPVHALGSLTDGSPFLAMKLVAGRTLAEELTTTDRPRLLRAFAQVCQAVGFAHSRGVIHRDLKPQNVMVGAFDEVQVMDWGLAKDVTSQEAPDLPRAQAMTEPVGTDADQTTSLAAPGESTDGRTRAGQVMGTPAYMAPEQARGEPTDARTDVFALGGILCKILTGQPPFRGQSSREVICRAAVGELVEAHARLDGCEADAELVALCRHCLSADPQDRPADGQTVADALTAHLNGVEERLRTAERERAVSAARAEEEAKTRQVAEEKAAEQRKRRKVQLLLLASIVGLLIATGSGVVFASLRQDAVRAKGIAETAQSKAEQAEKNEAIAHKATEQARARLFVFEYGATMRVAHQDWRDDDVPAALAHLDDTRDKSHGWEWDYVHRLCHPYLLALTGHTGSVSSASFSTDGTRIVTAGGEDMTAKLWDAKTGEVLLTFKGHTNYVAFASFSADGARVVTASLDKTAKIWDAKTGKPLLTINGGPNYITTAAFSPDGEWVVTTGSDTPTAKIWNAKTGKEVHTLRGHTGEVIFAAFSPDGTRIVTTSSDATAKIWEVPSTKPEGFAKAGNELLTLKGHTAPVTSAMFSADGTRVVTSSADMTAKVWEVPSAKPEGVAKAGNELLTLKGHRGAVTTASFRADGARIVTASVDKTVKVWEVPLARLEGVAKTGTAVLTLKGHPSFISAASYSPDGARILTVSGTALVWDANTDPEALTLRGHAGGITVAAFRADGSQAVTAGDDATAKVWDTQTGKELHTLTGHTAVVTAASLSPDQTRVVTIGADDTVKVWEVPAAKPEGVTRTGTAVRTFKLPKQGIMPVSSATNGSRVVSSSGGTTRVWDAATGTEVLTFKSHNPGDWVVSINADGTRVVTAGQDSTAQVWDATTGTVQFVLKGHREWVTCASFSPDGAWIVTGSLDKTACVWDAKTGAEVITMSGHTAPLTSAAFNPDGSRLVTGSGDRSAKVWETKTGAEVLTLKGHMSEVTSVSFSREGSRILTGGRDGTARVWDSRPMASVPGSR